MILLPGMSSFLRESGRAIRECESFEREENVFAELTEAAVILLACRLSLRHSFARRGV